MGLPTTHPRSLSKVLLIVVPVLLLTGAGGLVLDHFWPYTESSVRDRLASAASATVRFGSFHEKYFPPGCVAEDVIFQRNSSGPALISIRRLTIRSGLTAIFRGAAGVIRAYGMHVTLAHSDFGETKSSEQRTTIGEFIADGAILEVRHGDGEQPLRFVFHKFRLQDLGGPDATSFAAEFDNPFPAGVVQTSGKFGPWNSSDPAATVVSGKYSLKDADMNVFHSVAGKISSVGDFKGTFKKIDVEGSTTAPKFEITSTRHEQALQSQFSVEVSAINGETTLSRVKAAYGRDEIEAHGNIERGPSGKREAVLELTCRRGRIEDTFYPFIESPKSPITGNVAFEMHVVIPSGNEDFMKKLQLRSDFRIEDVRFTNSQTEQRLQKISERPGQKQPDQDAPATMSGRVSVTSGVAHFPELGVRDQDASAQFRGNYGLMDERVNMHGSLTTKASLAKTTSGIRAVFAKALEPLFKTKHNEKSVPVRISGTYHHPSFGLDMNSRM